MSDTAKTVLRRDWDATCVEPVTHIGSSGYVYCAEVAVIHRVSGQESIREMTADELRACVRYKLTCRH